MSQGNRRGATAAARRRVPIARLVCIVSVALLIVNGVGLRYYLSPAAERARSGLHAWLKPSGLVGQGLGIVAFALFLFIWLYPLRKKFKWLNFSGALCHWIDLHVAVGLILPLMVATHASWRFTGLIGLGYASMLAVCLSGVIGRYLYTRIPRSQAGLELGLKEAGEERRALLDALAATTGLACESLGEALAAEPLSASHLGPLSTLRQMVRDDLAARRAARALARRCSAGGGSGSFDRKSIRRVAKLARRQMALSQQARMLEASQRVFRYWHVAHRPIAITALFAVLVHVGVAVITGSTWFL